MKDYFEKHALFYENKKKLQLVYGIRVESASL